jgi:polysaccharide export outer membrane protein
MRSRNVWLAVCLSVFLCAKQQAQSKQNQIYAQMPDSTQSNLPGQKIGANDLIGVSVYDAPELTRTVRVSSDGFIMLPMVKGKLKADGLLPMELEKAIYLALQQGGILVEPIVTVTVVEYRSRPISVIGAVKRPGTFQAAGPMTLLEALGRAEGLSPDAGPEILLSRPEVDSSSKRFLTRISVRDLIERANPELNVELRGGEEIRVPEAKHIYVAGNVKKPGAFTLREGSPMTVMKALSLAEGISPFSMKTGYILRPVEGGPKKEIPIELARILKRESADVDLEPEDLLYIPENSRRKTTTNIAEKAAGFGLATISGVLIWRR